MKLWDLSIRQPVFMTMILAAGIVMGIYSYFRMPVDLFPDVEFPVVVVVTVYPGASPSEIQDQVTDVLEKELSTIGGIDQVNSTSAEGVSTIVLQFSLDESADSVNQEVRERVGLLRNQLPTGIQEPVVRRFNPSDQPIFRFGVADTTKRLSPVELRKLVDDDIQAELQRVPGVAAVDVSGGQVREIQINLDLQALQARRIAPQQVQSALQTQNLNIPGGEVTDGTQSLLVRTPGNFQTLDDIRNVVISQRGATPVYLRDVATVVDGFEARESLTRLNGDESVVVSVRKQSGTNTVSVTDAVKERLNQIAQSHPDLAVVAAGDQSIQVKRSTDGAFEDLIWGSLLASLVIFFFFRDLRNTLITIGGLPVIMIATLFFMDIFGIGLNQLSLLALALVVGLVIDDAIVVRENIMRWIQKGYKPREAASLGTQEVVLAVIATSSTILAVFLPVAYAEGIIGRFFRDFGLTVAIAIAVSTFESLTMAPMLSAYFFRAAENEERIIDESHGEETAANSLLNRIYAAILNWSMDHKLITIVVALLFMGGSVYSVRFIEQTFLPRSDAAEFIASMRLPAGTPLTVTEREAVKVESILRQYPLVTDVFTTIGGTGTPEAAEFYVKLQEGSDYVPVVDALRPPLASVPGLSFRAANGGPGGTTTDIAVDVVAPPGVSFEELGQQAIELGRQIGQIPGITDLDVSYKPGRPEMQVEVDREHASQLGLSTAQIGSTIRLLVNGEVVSTYRGEGTEADIRLQLQEQNRASAEDILDINLLSPAGQLVPLRTIATLQNATGLNKISRVDRQPTVTINANVTGRDVPIVTREVSEFLSQAPLANGITAKLGGNADAQTDAFTNLGLAMLLSIVFIYMVLASQFASFIQPLLIMLALPLAVIGAILALLLTGRPLDLTAFIGFIMLMGLVTKNSILLVDFANQARARGETADRAMRLAGPIRLRPILMTSFSMILAMIPVALGLSAGGEFRAAMAIAIMGGLITSTFLTLLVVPAFYGSVVGFLDRVAARRAARAEARDAARRQRKASANEGAAQPVGD
ncbi:MAG: efflux RND transporter permease subunit [Caldilineaceae bacterium]